MIDLTNAQINDRMDAGFFPFGSCHRCAIVVPLFIQVLPTGLHAHCPQCHQLVDIAELRWLTADQALEAGWRLYPADTMLFGSTPSIIQ